MEPAWVLHVRSGAYPSRLVPDVSDLSQCAACLLLCERGYRVPHAGGMKRPSDGSGNEHPKVEVPTCDLDLRLSDLILKAESDHSSGSLAGIQTAAGPYQTLA